MSRSSENVSVQGTSVISVSSKGNILIQSPFTTNTGKSNRDLSYFTWHGCVSHKNVYYFHQPKTKKLRLKGYTLGKVHGIMIKMNQITLISNRDYAFYLLIISSYMYYEFILTICTIIHSAYAFTFGNHDNEELF